MYSGTSLNIYVLTRHHFTCSREAQIPTSTRCSMVLIKATMSVGG